MNKFSKDALYGFKKEIPFTPKNEAKRIIDNNKNIINNKKEARDYKTVLNNNLTYLLLAKKLKSNEVAINFFDINRKNIDLVFNFHKIEDEKIVFIDEDNNTFSIPLSEFNLESLYKYANLENNYGNIFEKFLPKKSLKPDASVMFFSRKEAKTRNFFDTLDNFKNKKKTNTASENGIVFFDIDDLIRRFGIYLDNNTYPPTPRFFPNNSEKEESR